MIDELETNDRKVIFAGVNFLREATSAYGNDIAYNMWKALESELPENIRGLAFQAILMGEAFNKVYIDNSCYTGIESKKVNQIKAVRVATRLGLKEAKNIIDRSVHGAVELIVPDEIYDSERMLILNSPMGERKVQLIAELLSSGAKAY